MVGAAEKPAPTPVCEARDSTIRIFVGDSSDPASGGCSLCGGAGGRWRTGDLEEGHQGRRHRGIEGGVGGGWRLLWATGVAR
jgi:hypothetical protein